MSELAAANDVFALKQDNDVTRKEVEHVQESILKANGSTTDRTLELLKVRELELDSQIDAFTNLENTFHTGNFRPIIHKGTELEKILSRTSSVGGDPSQIERINQDLIKFSNELDELEGKIYRSCEERKNNAEAAYDGFSPLSFLLFFLGWLLGLLGGAFGPAKDGQVS